MCPSKKDEIAEEVRKMESKFDDEYKYLLNAVNTVNQRKEEAAAKRRAEAAAKAERMPKEAAACPLDIATHYTKRSNKNITEHKPPRKCKTAKTRYMERERPRRSR